MSDPVEKSPNIGPVLGARLRAVGIETREQLVALGDAPAFALLIEKFPDDACASSRLAIAGAVRGVRWWSLPADLKASLTVGLGNGRPSAKP